jgi:hypothetical protein
LALLAFKTLSMLPKNISEIKLINLTLLQKVIIISKVRINILASPINMLLLDLLGMEMEVALEGEVEMAEDILVVEITEEEVMIQFLTLQIF